MLHFSRWKTIAILAACLIGLIGAIPNFFDKERVVTWPFPFNKTMNLGLDLQGGAHFLLSMDTSVLRRDWLGALVEDARQKMRAAKIATAGIGVREGRVVVNLTKPEDMDAALKELRPMAAPLESANLGGTVTTTIEVQTRRRQPDLADADGARHSRARGTRHRRCHRNGPPSPRSRGTREMTIVRQGRDRMLVQIPGIDDPKLVAEYKESLEPTAKMTFHLVHPSMTAEDAKAGRTPPGLQGVPVDGPSWRRRRIAFGRAPADRRRSTQRADPSFDRPHWPAGALVRASNRRRRARSARYTAENIGRRFAIVLDGKVLTAPVIQSAILDGTGQITGSFTVEEVTKLAIQLRSGALPAPLTHRRGAHRRPLARRRQYPGRQDRDHDRGRAGRRIHAVRLRPVRHLRDHRSGHQHRHGSRHHGLDRLVADLAGIAGILLTIGMAVDANVLIYERIREELRNKVSPVLAIEKGFDRAFGTIVDANLTTLIAGLVMFWLGSGPIKGFAITLCFGILTTIFTAYTVTRLLVSWWLASQKTKKIEAPL